jgi:hypothetical protein
MSRNTYSRQNYVNCTKNISCKQNNRKHFISAVRVDILILIVFLMNIRYHMKFSERIEWFLTCRSVRVNRFRRLYVCVLMPNSNETTENTAAAVFTGLGRNIAEFLPPNKTSYGHYNGDSYWFTCEKSSGVKAVKKIIILTIKAGMGSRVIYATIRQDSIKITTEQQTPTEKDIRSEIFRAAFVEY